jgi:hypothetical protein
VARRAPLKDSRSDNLAMGEEMKSSARISLRRSANLLLVAMVLLACSLSLPLQAGPTSPIEGAPRQPAGSATASNSLAAGPATPTGATAGQAGATAGPTAVSGRLAVSDSYRLQVAKGMLGFSLTAGPGKVWIGTGGGGYSRSRRAERRLRAKHLVDSRSEQPDKCLSDP